MSAVILAAGSSSRMGRPKQLLALGDRPLLQHVVDEAVASKAGEVVVVLGHRAEEIAAAIEDRGSARVVVNDEHESGQGSSLRVGLAAVATHAGAAAVLLGDQPGVCSGLIDRVVEAFLAGEKPAARPVYGGDGGRRVAGHPVVLARSLWPRLTELDGDEGARGLLAEHPQWLLEVEVEGEPPADVDTLEDYRRTVAGREARV